MIREEYVDKHVAFIFGIDDALLGAGVGLFGGVLNNLFAGSRQDDAQSFNATQALMNQQFNAAQAAQQRDWASSEASKARDFTGDWALRSQQFNAVEAATNRQFNAAEALKARDWTEEMSSTAYQRTMADMAKAGLNPILAYRQGATGNPGAAMASGSAASSGGASASAPGGASASGSPAHTSAAQVFDILQPAISTAMAVQRLKSELNRMDAETVRTLEQAATEKSVRQELGTRSSKQKAEESNIEAIRGEMEARGARGSNEAQFHKSWIGNILDTAGAGGQSLSRVISPILGLTRAAKDAGFAKNTFEGRWY